VAIEVYFSTDFIDAESITLSLRNKFTKQLCHFLVFLVEQGLNALKPQNEDLVISAQTCFLSMQIRLIHYTKLSAIDWHK